MSYVHNYELFVRRDQRLGDLLGCLYDMNALDSLKLSSVLGDAYGSLRVGYERSHQKKELLDAWEKGISLGNHKILAIASTRENSQVKEAVAQVHDVHKKIWSNNLGLVPTVVSRYRKRGMPLDDLVQEGNLGLYAAIVRYEPHREVSLSVYAGIWIRQSVLVALPKTMGLSISSPAYQKAMRLARLDAEYEVLHGQPAPAEVVVERLGLKAEAVTDVNRWRKPLVDIAQVADAELLSEQELPEAVVHQQHMGALLRGYLEELSDKDLAIIKQRYPLSASDPLPLQSIGVQMGVTRERIRQREVRALMQLRSMLLRDGIPFEEAL